jgi:hypothetical protein
VHPNSATSSYAPTAFLFGGAFQSFFWDLSFRLVQDALTAERLRNRAACTNFMVLLL